jgi:glycosyltransferase involved in cell wall biosynthesis
MYQDGIGNAYGYMVHNNTLVDYTKRVCPIDNEFEDAIHIIPAENFIPLPGKVNWLFTMFEGEEVPDFYLDNMKKADYLLAPSYWVKNLFSKYFDPEKIFVVHHGVEPFFTYKKRKFPKGKKFQFLWVGAPNPRKGFQEIIAAWKHVGFQDVPNIRLYVKTTRHPGVKQNGNVIVNGSNISRGALLNIYHRSHAFIFPTRGEGFGLTLAEAMRTGLPCISPSYTGVADFFDEEVGYVIPHEIKKSRVRFIGREDLGWWDTEMSFPDAAEMSKWMSHVVVNYDEALAKGRKAHERMRDRFTWERSAATLVETVRSKWIERRERNENPLGNKEREAERHEVWT